MPSKVFISYSHDSREHETAVLALASRLRGDGVDAVLDQYESFPPQGWIAWMQQQVRSADFVLMICTEAYRHCVESGQAPDVRLGATYETQRIQQILYNSGGVNERFIPVVMGAGDREHIPLDFQKYQDYALDTGYEDLYRLLTNQPKTRKPVLGKLRALDIPARRPDFRNQVWTAPQRNRFFTGREDTLEALRAGAGQPQAISGQGGLGKTQTAIEYAHRYREEYDAVLWTVAESRAALVSGFGALARHLDLPEKDEADVSRVAAATWQWLTENGRWLLVLDDVADMAEVREFLPDSPRGHVLMTTRLRAGGEVADCQGLRKMDPDEGARLLLRRAKLPDTGAYSTAALEIAVEVAGLPLALDQAAAYIEEMHTTPAEYLELYRAEGKALRARRGELAGGHASVTVTYSLALQRLEERNPAGADLVRVCAFLAADAIPGEIFTEGGERLGDRLSAAAAKLLAWLEAVASAERFGLLTKNTDGSLEIHRLVQDVTRDEMDYPAQRQWGERVVEALNAAFPDVEFRTWPLCERLLPHARLAAGLVARFGMESSAASRLLNQAASYLNDRAGYGEAGPLYRRALEIREKALGPDHPDTGTSLNNLALLYRNQARYAAAEPLYRRALGIREKALGPDHPATATSLNNLAGLYDNQGRYAAAEPLYRRALDIHEKALGPDHPDTATSLNNLALLYHNQGRYAEAEPLHRRALDIREKALGPDHPNTAQSLKNLASLYEKQGRYAEAEPLYRHALGIREKALGPDHPATATSLNNLAGLYDNQGRYAEAEPLYRRALDIREKALGPDHPDTARSLNNLAGLDKNLGRCAEAEPPYRRALDIFEKALGTDHPDTAQSHNNLAVLYHNLGRYAEAEPLYRRALEIREKALGPDHPDTAQGLNNLAGLCINQGRYAEAEPLYRRALSICEQALGPDHPDTAQSLNSLAVLYNNRGRYAEAEPLYRRALGIREKALGPDHPDTAQSLNNLAGLYHNQGRHAEAEPLYRRALDIFEKALGPQHPQTAQSIRNYAALLRKLDHRSLNIDTFNPIYVLMGHALPEEAPARSVQRGGDAQTGVHPQVSH